MQLPCTLPMVETISFCLFRYVSCFASRFKCKIENRDHSRSGMEFKKIFLKINIL